MSHVLTCLRVVSHSPGNRMPLVYRLLFVWYTFWAINLFCKYSQPKISASTNTNSRISVGKTQKLSNVIDDLPFSLPNDLNTTLKLWPANTLYLIRRFVQLCCVYFYCMRLVYREWNCRVRRGGIDWINKWTHGSTIVLTPLPGFVSNYCWAGLFLDRIYFNFDDDLLYSAARHTSYIPSTYSHAFFWESID